MTQEHNRSNIRLQGVDILLENWKGKVHVPTTMGFALANSFKIRKDERVADIGTGTGIQAILAKKLGAKEVYATDISKNAVELTKINALRNYLEIEILQRHLFEPLKGRLFDVILLDIPQLPEVIDLSTNWHPEKHSAGDDGISLITALVQSKNYLKPTGRMYTLGTSINNFSNIRELIQKAGYQCKTVSEVKIPFNFQMFQVLPFLEKQKWAKIIFQNNMYYWTVWVYELTYVSSH